MFRRFIINLLIIVIAASVAAAQIYPPGATRCFIPTDVSHIPRCNRSMGGARNKPPTVTLSVNPDDERNLDLCARSMLSDEECATLLGNINLLASASDPEDNNLLFTYSSTGGRITSEGHMAVWNLTGVNFGSYTASVDVDDGCGCVAFSSATVTIKMPAPKWLNGIWEGIGYQWDTETAWPLTLSAESDKYTIDYPTLKCSGQWTLLNATADTATFREEMTVNAENCAQGETVRIKKLPSGELGARYTHSGLNETNAAAVLTARKALKKPAPPRRGVKKSVTRPTP